MDKYFNSYGLPTDRKNPDATYVWIDGEGCEPCGVYKLEGFIRLNDERTAPETVDVRKMNRKLCANKPLTIKELYELACKNGLENAKLTVVHHSDDDFYSIDAPVTTDWVFLLRDEIVLSTEDRCHYLIPAEEGYYELYDFC